MTGRKSEHAADCPECHAEPGLGRFCDHLQAWDVAVAVVEILAENITDLVKAGLRDEFSRFYRDMQQALTTSQISAVALATLAISSRLLGSSH